MIYMTYMIHIIVSGRVSQGNQCEKLCETCLTLNVPLNPRWVVIWKALICKYRKRCILELNLCIHVKAFPPSRNSKAFPREGNRPLGSKTGNRSEFNKIGRRPDFSLGFTQILEINAAFVGVDAICYKTHWLGRFWFGSYVWMNINMYMRDINVRLPISAEEEAELFSCRVTLPQWAEIGTKNYRLRDVYVRLR